MAIDITPARVRATADLARLDLGEHEITPLAAQLQTILGYISELEALDLRDVPPWSPEPSRGASSVSSVLRGDNPEPELDHREALSQAPRREKGAFAVPQFVAE